MNTWLDDLDKGQRKAMEENTRGLRDRTDFFCRTDAVPLPMYMYAFWLGTYLRGGGEVTEYVMSNFTDQMPTIPAIEEEDKWEQPKGAKFWIPTPTDVLERRQRRRNEAAASSGGWMMLTRGVDMLGFPTTSRTLPPLKFLVIPAFTMYSPTDTEIASRSSTAPRILSITTDESGELIATKSDNLAVSCYPDVLQALKVFSFEKLWEIGIISSYGQSMVYQR